MAKRPKFSEEDFPPPGTVFVAPVPDGRFSVGRVIRRQFEGGAPAALVAASPWIGREVPGLDRAEIRETLVLTHHNHRGRPEIFWVRDLMPPEFRIIGQIELASEDQVASSNVYTGWQSVPIQAYMQWRWDHDREALLADDERKRLEESEARRREAHKRSEILAMFTLGSLMRYRWFPKWEEARPTLPIDDARRVMSDLVGELHSSDKRTKSLTKRALKAAVVEFNRLDACGQFIDTIVREDICEAFEYVMSAAGYPDLTDSIEDWREW